MDAKANTSPPGASGVDNLKVASINVNGLRLAAKRRSIFDRLRKGKFDVCLIQESHCTQEEATIWRSEWGGPAHFYHGTSSSRGVIILLDRNPPYKVVREVRDKNGRILLLQLSTDEASFVIGSLYAPTADAPEEQGSFMDTLEDFLADLSPVKVILGGDLNVALDPVKDRNNNSRPTSNGEVMRLRVHTLLDDQDLTDVWRYRNPLARQFTFHRAAQASRIDYWVLSNHLLDVCSTSDMIPLVLSDHCLITLSIGVSSHKRGPGLWLLDNTLLNEDAYIEEIAQLLESLSNETDVMEPSAKWEWIKYNIRKKTVEFETDRRRQRRKEEKELNKRLTSLTEQKDRGELQSLDELESVKRELAEIELARAQKNNF